MTKTKVEITMFPTTPDVKEKLQILFDLEESKSQVMRPVGLLKRRYDSESVIALTEAVAKARTRVWAAIGDLYPDTLKGNWTADLNFITKKQ